MSMSKGAALNDSRPTTAAITEAGARYIPPGYDSALYRTRHSAAHLLAQAIKEHFASDGAVLFGIGPPTSDGFYYDFALPRPLSEDELPQIEERMRTIIREAYSFDAWEVTADQARTL